MNRQSGCAFALLLTTIASPGVPQTPTSDLGFDSMAQPEEPVAECTAPRPPRELDSFAYVRNGYREILRILAAERALEDAYCNCRFDAVSWEDAVEALERFRTSDNPKLPFDVIELRKTADALEIDLEANCSE